MKLARVVGTVVTTIHAPALDGRRLLVCALVDPGDGDLDRHGRYTLAVDAVGAGAGETVLVLDEGSSARQVLDDPTAPVRAVVVGVVDTVTGAGT